MKALLVLLTLSPFLLCACKPPKASQQVRANIDMSSPTNTVTSIWALADSDARKKLTETNPLESFLSPAAEAKVMEGRKAAQNKAIITPIMRRIEQVQDQPPDRALVITKEQTYPGSTNYTTHRYAMLLVGSKWQIDDVVKECWHWQGALRRRQGSEVQNMQRSGVH